MNRDRDYIDKLKVSAANNITKLLEILGVSCADFGPMLKATCPMRGHPGDRDNISAFCWWYDSRTWACFSHQCHIDLGNDIIGLVRGITGKNFDGSVSFLRDFVHDKLELTDEQIKAADITSIKVKQQNRRVHETRLKFLMKDEDGLEFLLSRGFSIDVLRRFDVGFWSRLGSYMHDRIVIPVRDFDGYVVGFTGRTIWPESEWKNHGVREKWKHGSDYIQYVKGSFHKSVVVFNLNNAKDNLGDSKIVYVVEGPLDGFKLSMAGVDNWIACLGSSFSSAQRALLVRAGVLYVYLAFDNDEAGCESRNKLNENLKDYFHVHNVELPDEKDPGDLSIEEVTEIFNHGEDSVSEVLP